MFVHNVSAAFGYDYNDATPDWVHPFIHLILVLAPALLISVGSYLAIRGVLKLWRHLRTPAFHQSPYEGSKEVFQHRLALFKKAAGIDDRG